MLIMLNFIKELLVRCITEFLKGCTVWLTKSNQRLTPLIRYDNTITVMYMLQYRILVIAHHHTRLLNPMLLLLLLMTMVMMMMTQL